MEVKNDMQKKPDTKKIIIFAIIAFALLIFPFIAKNRYQIHIMNMVGIYALLSLGLNIAMGYAGQMNLAMGALWAVGAYTAGLLNQRLGFSLWITLPLAIVAGGLVGGFVGLPALKVRAHYLSIVTIGLNEVINIILVNETKITGGVDGISKIAKPVLFGFPINTEQRYYYLILLAVVITYLIARQILSGRVGRNFRAIRDDYKTAPAMGVNAGFYKLLAFIISGAIAGAAGALYAHLNAYISPDIFEHKTTLFIMTLSMIGGLGNLNGSLIGAFILPVLQEYLRAIQDWQYVVYGLAIMVVVLFVPGGLMQLTSLLKPYFTHIMFKLKSIVAGTKGGEDSHVS
jgi:branched-chain amino acid transport system permease protein